MAAPIRHAECGGIAFWYVGDKYQPAVRSQDIVYLDGTRPAYASMVPKCPACGGGVHPYNLKRCFDEDIDLGFDVIDAAKNGILVNPVGTPDSAIVSELLRKRNVARWILVVATILFVAVVVADLTR